MIKDKIKELCKEKGISVKQLEQEAGLGEGTIKKWSQFNPRVDNVKKVADTLEVSIDELLQAN